MYDESEKRILFGRNYCFLASLFHLASFFVVLVSSIQDSEVENYSECVAVIAKKLSSLTFVSFHLLTMIGSILMSKRWSQYKRALNFPRDEKFSVNWDKVNKTQFARRIGLHLRSMKSKMVPWMFCLQYVLVCVLVWILTAYIVVCLGAPFLSEHFKTASFVTCLCLNSVWPIILIEGPDLNTLLSVIQAKELDPLGKILYLNAWAGMIGAWVGAIPIPLDWDRPWQVWPLTCVLGSFAFTALIHLWSSYDLFSIQYKLKKSTLLGLSKKKGT